MAGFPAAILLAMLAMRLAEIKLLRVEKGLLVINFRILGFLSKISYFL